VRRTPRAKRKGSRATQGSRQKHSRGSPQRMARTTNHQTKYSLFKSPNIERCTKIRSEYNNDTKQRLLSRPPLPIPTKFSSIQTCQGSANRSFSSHNHHQSSRRSSASLPWSIALGTTKPITRDSLSCTTSVSFYSLLPCTEQHGINTPILRILNASLDHVARVADDPDGRSFLYAFCSSPHEYNYTTNCLYTLSLLRTSYRGVSSTYLTHGRSHPTTPVTKAVSIGPRVPSQRRYSRSTSLRLQP